MARMHIPAATIDQICTLFPHHSDAQLAEQFGLKVRQVQYIGFSRRLHKTPETIKASAKRRQANQPAVPLKDRVAQVIAEAGDAGMSRDAIEAAIAGTSPSSITTAINKLVGERRAFRAGRPGHSRWFGTALQAQNYVETYTAKVSPAKLAPVKVPAARGPAHEPGEPRIPEGLQTQYGHPVPGPEARWHTNAQRHFAGRVGQYDADAPAAPWVTAATTRQHAEVRA